MPDYTNGKIYTIRHPDSEKYYIGSTSMPLHKRFSDHKAKYRANSIRATSKILFDLGIDDCYIELLENYPCNNKEELNKREGELHRQYKNELVNRYISGRTKEEYYNENIEHIKEYREANKDIKKENAITPYHCSCGLTIRTDYKARHMKTKNHLKSLL